MLINIGDVVDGALVSAIAVAGRRISVAVDGLRGPAARQRTDRRTLAFGPLTSVPTAILAVMLEAGLMMADTALKLGSLSDLAIYLARRRSESAELPELAVPEEFRQTFRDWAEGLVDLVWAD